MTTSRDDFLHTVRDNARTAVDEACKLIEAALETAKQGHTESFSVAMPGNMTSITMNAAASIYREGGWTVTSRSDRNEHYLDFS